VAGPIAAVIFDLDGVLVDSEPWWAESRRTVAAEHGGTWTPADEASVKGANSHEWSEAMRERLGLPLAAGAFEHEVVSAMVIRYRRGLVPRIDAGVAAVRRLASRYPLAIASSAHPEVLAAALDALRLAGVFRVVVSADEVAAGKPAPDVYLETARRLDVSPRSCLVIEDSPSGVRSARAAGMRVAWVGAVANESEGERLGASLVLPSLAALDRTMLDALSAMQ
jgi:HAD superfamily hydrolase (TIGR01509 family)